MSPCPGVTKGVTEGGTGTWHRIGPQGWAQRQCGIGRRHWTQNQEPQVQFSALLPTSSVTSAKEATSRFWTCFHTRRSRTLPAPRCWSLQNKTRLSSKGFRGVSSKLNWQREGLGRAPQLSHFTLLKEGGGGRPQPENSPETHCRQGAWRRLFGSPRASQLPGQLPT